MATVKEIENVYNRLIKSARTNSHRVHIISRESGWAVFMEGNVKATKVTSLKEEAIDYGRQLVQEGKASKLVVHDKAGNIVTG